MDPIQIALFLLAGSALGVSLWRGVVRRQRQQVEDPLTVIRRELEHVGTTPEAKLRQWEVELHDYSRGVNARIENRLAMLDGLLSEARLEIDRLDGLLTRSRSDLPIDRSLTPAELQRAANLLRAGLTSDEVSRVLGIREATLVAALGEQRRAA